MNDETSYTLTPLGTLTTPMRRAIVVMGEKEHEVVLGGQSPIEAFVAAAMICWNPQLALEGTPFPSVTVLKIEPVGDMDHIHIKLTGETSTAN